MAPGSDVSSGARDSERNVELFRQKALDQLSSPDQLNELMRLTRPVGWLALAAIAALLAGVVIWGFLGRLSVSVDGSGILLRRGGLLQVAAPEGGAIERLEVKVGDQVAAGQEIGRLSNSRLARDVATAEAEVSALTASLTDLDAEIERQSASLVAIFGRKRSGLEAAIEVLEREEQRRRGELAALPEEARRRAESELDDLLERLSSRRIELADLELDRGSQLRELEAPAERLRRDLEQATSRFETLRRSREVQSAILAPQGGRVVEVLADEGDLLEPGQPVVAMELADGDLSAFLFVPAEAGRNIENGMVARVRLSDIERNDNLYLIGEVTRVADYPTTRQAMMRLLANDAFVDALLQDGPSLQVEVRLVRDAEGDGGYRWSSQPQTPRQLESGTLIRGNIVTDRDRPLAYVVPGLDEFLGL